ncbi:TetR family transcriptional regulator [Williamsia sp. CHRR-6]|uniref:TetR family transcriptional regulator n=1 Tax=Williamsia sp. CHRR-6 TaxID=2835871 RepID=UPI001BDAA2DE|nr:TetR family transcriptional regulator [Williamsia sp. CHRR-6]MBT0567391.1 TetR family transcriptional regulator [Williamsia sp. CHRR-6]
MSSTGLRETKKAATRDALARAVVRLSAQRGFDAVSVEAVAAEVGVSARTFHNYFASKDDALRAFMETILNRILLALEARPADEGFFDSATAAFMEVISDPGENPEELVQLMTLMDTEPSLVLNRDAGANDLITRFDELCAQRSTGPHGLLYTRLVLGCAGIAARVAFQQLNETGGMNDVLATLQHAFDHLRTGLATAPDHR